jgi:hypothetical protein
MKSVKEINDATEEAMFIEKSPKKIIEKIKRATLTV